MAVVVQGFPPSKAIRWDANTSAITSGSGASPTTFQWSHINAGNFIIVPAVVGFDGAESGYTMNVSYGGVGMIPGLGFLAPLGSVPAQCDVFYLFNPPKGPNFVQVNLDYPGTPVQAFAVGAVSYFNVGSIGSVQTSSTQTTEPVSQTASSAVGHVVSQFFFSYYTSPIWTPGPYNQNLRVNSFEDTGTTAVVSCHGGDASGAPSVLFTDDMAPSVATVGLALDLIPG